MIERKLLIKLVGTTGIEPATTTMSMTSQKSQYFQVFIKSMTCVALRCTNYTRLNIKASVSTRQWCSFGEVILY